MDLKDYIIKCVLLVIALTCTLSMLYVYWWSLINTGGSWFAVRLNCVKEFWFEFILLHIFLIFCIYVFGYLLKKRMI